MAITRAQQYRQMLKEGSKKPAMQGGGPNYLGKQPEVTVPKKWKSSPDHPDTELAYITEPEKKVLIALNMHGGLEDGKPNKGPEGIISLQGDMGPGGKGDYSEEGTGRGVGKSKDKDVSAFTDKGTGDYQISDRAIDRQAVMDYAMGKMGFQGGKKPGFFSGPGSFKAKQQVYNIQQRMNAIDKYNKSRKNKIMAGLKQLNISPAYDDPEETFADLIDNAPSIAGMTDKFNQKTIDDVLSGKRQIDFFSKIDPNLAPGLAPKALVGLANLIGPKMAGPVTKEKLNALLGEIETLKGIDPRNTTTKELMKTFSPNQYEMVYGTKKEDGRGDPNFLPVSSQIASTPSVEEDYYANIGGDPFANRDAFRFFNGGGIVTLDEAKKMAPPGESLAYINDDEADLLKSLGGAGEDVNGTGIKSYFFKSVKKAVKKATKTVKKIAKSPIGRAALLYAGGAYLGALGAGSAGTGVGLKMFGPKAFASNIGMSLGRIGLGSKFIGPKQPKTLMDILGGKAGVGILGASALAGLMTPKEEEEDDEEFYRGEGLNIAELRGDPYKFLSPRVVGSNFEFAADGGRIGYSKGTEGGAISNEEMKKLSKSNTYKGFKKMKSKGIDNDILMMNENYKKNFDLFNKLYDQGFAEGSNEPVAKKTMPLLDMGGKEMDLRAEGGFVPIGRMEKADDVPARLSKNEFVFTADAVRNAGEGNVDKGAEVMYNMMKNLEAGGDVSEESQGLKGARRMFQTSQRLEEVL